MISILGAGPHGHQLAQFYPDSTLYDDDLAGYEPCSAAPTRDEYLIGAMWPMVRRNIYNKTGLRDAYNDGRVVFPGVQLGYDVHLGEHVHILFNAVVSHGCEIGPFSTICSGAVLAGEVTVERSVFIGANATIRHAGITIGRGARIGMGAVVLSDVDAGTEVVGNPARPR